MNEIDEDEMKEMYRRKMCVTCTKKDNCKKDSMHIRVHDKTSSMYCPKYFFVDFAKELNNKNEEKTY